MVEDTLASSGDALVWLLACAGAGFLVDLLFRRALNAAARRSGSRTLRTLEVAAKWLPTWIGIAVGLEIAIRLIRPDLPANLRAVVRPIPAFLGVIVATGFSARILSRLVRLYTQREDTPLPSGSIFVNLTRTTVWAIGGAALLGTLGISVTPLITALGIGGLAVGLALQPTLENVFSGVQLIGSGQLAPGDFIRLESGEEGVVLDVTWRNTTVRRPSNDIVVVPNSVLARATFTNFSTEDPTYVLTIPVSFASAGDPDQVERIAQEVALDVVRTVPEAVNESEPGTRFAELTPPAAVLNVTIRCVGYQERITVRHEFIRRLAKRFAEEGVQAPPVAYAGARAMK